VEGRNPNKKGMLEITRVVEELIILSNLEAFNADLINREWIREIDLRD